MIGQEIAGRYRIEEVLGFGGFGRVYRGIDTQHNLPVAVKHLKPELVNDEQIERFKREGEALRELNHPNIVKMLDAVEDGDNHYLIMEYVSGGDLDDLLKQGTIPLEQTLTYAIDLADALTRAHKLNIIHRDLKPANVLIGEDGILRLTDFGVSRIGGKDKITETGAPIGTFAYMAPEVFSSDWIDPRADIWAFGVMLFEMLTGELPFQGNSLTQLIMNITANDVPDLAMLAPDVPPSLIKLIKRMLKKDRGERIATVRYVGAHLDDILHGREPSEPISKDAIPLIPTRKRHNLPTMTTSFVGRASEIEEVMRLIDEPSHRLITVLAQGGMGKTRIAIEIARHYIEQFRDGVFLVSLQALSNPDNIVSELAKSIDLPLQHGDETKQVLQFLANKHMLLVFDNYEHLLDGVSILADIMSHAPDTTMLVTSRERLHLTAETVYSLPEMACPMDVLQDMLRFDAVRFLIQSAQHAKSDWHLTDDNLDDVFKITQLTQGMPLGILLAMSWLDMMTIAEIAIEIQRDIDFLSADLRDLPDRHQSVRAIFNGTWNRLSDLEQSALAKMSIFRGGFTREAAQAVTGANVRVLHALTNKSLIQMDEKGRYSIHELLRQFAEEQLNQRGDIDEVRDVFISFYATLLSELSAVLVGNREIMVQNIIADFQNIQTAWLYAFKSEKWLEIRDMVYPLMNFAGNGLFINEHGSLVQMTLSKLIEQKSLSEAQEILFIRIGHYTLGFDKESVDDFLKRRKAIIELARKHNDKNALVFGLQSTSLLLDRHGFSEESKAYLEEAITLAHDYDMPYYQAWALKFRATLELIRGAFDACLSSTDQFERIAKNIGYELLCIWSNWLRGAVHMFRDEWQLAESLIQQALDSAYEQEIVSMVLDLNTLLFKQALYFGQMDQAWEYIEIIARLKESINTIGSQHSLQLSTAWMQFAQGCLDNILFLTEDQYSGLQITRVRDVLYEVTHLRALTWSILGDFVESIADLDYIFAYTKTLGWTSHLILDCMIFLPMLEDQGDDIRSVELIAMMNEHPKALPISNQHPYVLELEAELRERLDEDTYQQAWGRGAQLDPLVIAPALMEEFTAIYG